MPNQNASQNSNQNTGQNTGQNITMTLLVRNEEDIVAENIRFHRALGVDSFIVMDNRSTDSTRNILKDLSRDIPIEYLHQPEDTYDQRTWVTQMARHAARDHGADWVINTDADEFWTPTEGGLKALLSRLDARTGTLAVKRHNAVVVTDSHDKLAGRSHPSLTTLFEAESRNNLGRPLPGKVLHRAIPDVSVAQGNHAVEGVPGETELAGDRLRILHFPHRTLGHYKQKIRLGGAAYARNDRLPKGLGATWRAHFAGLEDGTVDRFWQDIVHFAKDLRSGIRSGSLFHDDVVAAFLRA